MSYPQGPGAGPQPPAQQKKGPSCIVVLGGGFLLLCFGFVGLSMLARSTRSRVVILRATGEGPAAISWDENGSSSQIAGTLPWERRMEVRPQGYVQLAVIPDRAEATCVALVDGVVWRRAVASPGGVCRVSGYLDL